MQSVSRQSGQETHFRACAITSPQEWVTVTWCVFCRQQPGRQWTGKIANMWHVFSVHGPCWGVTLTLGATTQLIELDSRVEVNHGKFVVEEELEVGVRRRNGWFWNFVCAVVEWYWECVIKRDFQSSCVKSVDRKSIVKTLLSLSHSRDLLPNNDEFRQI
jgi:hypothetical protein